MKVLKATKSVTFHVETDHADFGSVDRWENEDGPEWAVLPRRDGVELEAAFREWLEHNHGATSSVEITAAMIHYPEHWDTAAYPTLESAIREALAYAVYSATEEVAGEGQGPSRVFRICDRYELGYGHGFQNDGLDLSKTPHDDPEYGEAYRVGYEAGQEKYKSMQEKI